MIAAPTDAPDERIEVGVLIVGGGPAGLACAIRLGQLLEEDPATAERLGEVPVALVDKGKQPGSHLLSGAVMNPRAARRLFKGRPEQLAGIPTYGEVPGEGVYLLTRKRALRIPPPPTLRNHGNWIVSIAQMSKYLAELAEAGGTFVLPETAADRLLVQHGRVVGIRSGDKGRGREGEALGNFEPGSDIVAKVTVLAEGTAGHLTGAALDHFGLNGPEPQIWELGVKEIWRVPRPLTKVIHTMGWPLRKRAKYREFGGSWLYPMGEDLISLGFVVGLDYRDVELSAHDLLQEFKTHRFIRKILEGGERVAWGAKTITSGGWHAMPKSLGAPGLLLAGESAGLVDLARLKGVHFAIESGRLAAEAAYRSLQRGENPGRIGVFDAYDDEVRNGYLGKSLREVRNMRQAFEKGFFVGGGLASAMTVSKGHFPPTELHNERDAEAPLMRTGRASRYPAPDGALTFDKLSSVFASGNRTRDDQPNHVRIERNVPARRGRDVDVDVPGAGVRGRRRGRRRHRRGEADAVQLRPVRRDHRPRWPADAARGRLRAGVHADLGRLLLARLPGLRHGDALRQGRMAVEEDVRPERRVGVREVGLGRSRRTACAPRPGSRVVWSAFQSASASMRRLISACAGASASSITATTRSASGTAAASPIPPRRRVARMRTYAAGSAKSPNHASAFGMCLLEWWPISWARTTRISGSEKLPSTIVLQSTTLREGPKPTAYAFAWLVVSLTSSIEIGIFPTPCSCSNSRAACRRPGSRSGSVGTRYGCTNAKNVADREEHGRPGNPPHLPEPPRQEHDDEESEADRDELGAELEPVLERPLEVAGLRQVVAPGPPDVEQRERQLDEPDDAEPEHPEQHPRPDRARRRTRVRSAGRAARNHQSVAKRAICSSTQVTRKNRSTWTASCTTCLAEDLVDVD